MRQALIPYIHDDGTEWEYYFTDPKTRIIYYERRLNSKRIKFSTRETNGNKAKRFANAELEIRLGKKAKPRKLIRDHLKNWLNIKETEGLDIYTLYGIRRAKTEIAEYWGDMLPSEITRDTMAEFYLWWRENKKHQMENVLKWLKNFCRYLHETMENGHSVLPAVPKIKDPNRDLIKMKRAKAKERTFTKAEVAKIRKAAASPDDELVALIMHTMATRIEETLQLDFGRTVLLDEPVPVYRWYFGQNKADHFGQHALHLALIPRLQALRERRRAEGTLLLFPQARDNQKSLRSQMIDWDAWRARADLGWHWTAHTFRHSTLTDLFNDEKNPQAALCKQYRVSLEVALETYVKTTSETMLRLRDAIEVPA